MIHLRHPETNLGITFKRISKLSTFFLRDLRRVVDILVGPIVDILMYLRYLGFIFDFKSLVKIQQISHPKGSHQTASQLGREPLKARLPLVKSHCHNCPAPARKNRRMT